MTPATLNILASGAGVAKAGWGVAGGVGPNPGRPTRIAPLQFREMYVLWLWSPMSWPGVPLVADVSVGCRCFAKLSATYADIGDLGSGLWWLWRNNGDLR